jgi:hypothetical protein
MDTAIEYGELRRFVAREAERGIHACAYTAVLPMEPVKIKSSTNVGSSAVELRRRYRNVGFATFELTDEYPSQESVLNLAHSLGLGKPFVPPMYRKGAGTADLYDQTGVNVLTADARRDDAGAHPAFRATNGQRLHSDGTLQSIGEVPTSILVCATPAAEGGASTVFNAVAAFCRLARRDVESAALLLTDCLRRTATVGPIGDTHLGPAFAFRNGELLSRFSVTSTDSWECPTDVPTARFEAACAAIEASARPGSDLYGEFHLGERQGILMANDKISHGRQPYADSQEKPREMLRGLFVRRPSPSGSDSDALLPRLIYGAAE